MDPTQVLASQILERHSAVPSQAQIDAFYNEHGNDAFLLVRRWQETLRAALSAARSTKTAWQSFALSRRKV